METVFFGLFFLVILLAVIAYLRTPKNERHCLPTNHVKKEGVEYAEEYTKEEVAKYTKKSIFLSLFFIAGYIGLEYVFDNYSPACQLLGPATGFYATMYSVVTLPAFFALLTAYYHGKYFITVYRIKIYPPPGTKVYRPTRVVRGFYARIRSILFFMSVLFFLGLSIYCFYLLENVIDLLDLDKLQCN